MNTASHDNEELVASRVAMELLMAFKALGIAAWYRFIWPSGRRRHPDFAPPARLPDASEDQPMLPGLLESSRWEFTTRESCR